MDWLRHTLSVGRGLGFEIDLIDIKRKLPAFIPITIWMESWARLYTPNDGHVDPSNLTAAFATGARNLGVRIFRQTRATNIKRVGDDWLVESEKGAITCEHVVNAGGTYARQIGEWSGLQLPMTSMTHHYLVTDTVPEFQTLTRELPVVRDDKLVSGYIRMEQKSALIGIYEKQNPKRGLAGSLPLGGGK